MRTRLANVLVILAVAAGACSDASGPTAVKPRLALSAPDRAEFQVRGASYGPNGEEMTGSDCSATYAWATDSTNWAVGGGTPIWVRETSYDRQSCTYWQGWSEDLRVGGNLSMYVDGDTFAGVGIVADQQAVGTLTNVPTTGTTLYLTASSWDNYVFQYWRIRNAAATYEYYDCNPNIERPADTQDYDFLAVFKEGRASPCGSYGFP